MIWHIDIGSNSLKYDLIHTLCSHHQCRMKFLSMIVLWNEIKNKQVQTQGWRIKVNPDNKLHRAWVPCLSFLNANSLELFTNKIDLVPALAFSIKWSSKVLLTKWSWKFFWWSVIVAYSMISFFRGSICSTSVFILLRRNGRNIAWSFAITYSNEKPISIIYSL